MKAVPNEAAKSEVQSFAMNYHQDFGILEPNPVEISHDYVDSLSRLQRRTLKKELLRLLADYPGKDSKGLQNAWRRAGAQWWSRDLNLRSFLSGVIDIL